MEKILLWAAMLVAFGVSVEYAMYVNKPRPLDMAPDSVDDNYNGCQDKMRDKVKKEYLNNELNKNNNFTKAWNKAGNFYKTWGMKTKSLQCERLQKEHVMALYVYTLGQPYQIYPDFNQAVRTQRAKYASTNFSYHALHFYVTEAIQILNSKTSNDKRCVTTYRRVDLYFDQNVLNKEFRFGAFTSSSKGDYPSIKFGKRSCFNITSCFGADITHCSSLGNHEREVLIPPYEVFKVTDIKNSSALNEKLPCEMVYTVQSTRSLSNLQCALIPK